MTAYRLNLRRTKNRNCLEARLPSQFPLLTTALKPRKLMKTAMRMGTIASISLSLAFASALPAQAQGEVKSVFGDWQLRCDTLPGAPSEQCALVQHVTSSNMDNVGLSVFILKTADNDARFLRVLAPLGVLLPFGLGVRVDGADMGIAAFTRCLAGGCISEIGIDENLFNTFKSGGEAIFIVYRTPEEGIAIPVSLEGFSAGYDALP